jgi:hypothetical protein
VGGRRITHVPRATPWFFGTAPSSGYNRVYDNKEEGYSLTVNLPNQTIADKHGPDV